jgi:hypothetical protein
LCQHEHDVLWRRRAERPGERHAQKQVREKAKQGADIRSDPQTFLPLWGRSLDVRLQLVLGNDRAEVPLDNLERLENRPLREELGVILRALSVVAATRILGWMMTDGIPTPAAGCGGIGVDGRCQLVVATVAHVAKAVEMSVLRLDKPEPRVPKRMSPAQGLEQRRVDLPRAVHSDSRPLAKTVDSVHVTANKPGTRCSAEHTHLSRRRTFSIPRRSRAARSAPDTEGTGLEPEPLATRSSPLMRAYLPGEFYPRYNDQIEELIAKEGSSSRQIQARCNLLERGAFGRVGLTNSVSVRGFSS